MAGRSGSAAAPTGSTAPASALVVVDYKTGSPKRFQAISAADPTAAGTKLQLPVYAHAARAGAWPAGRRRVG